MKEALRRAIAIRDGINRKTGVNDKNITDGVNKLTHDKTIILPSVKMLSNIEDCEVSHIVETYTELQYLESTSRTCIIDTGIIPTPNTRVIIDMEFTEDPGSSASFLMGCGYNNISGNSGRFSFMWGWDYSQASHNFIFNIINASNYAWINAGFADTNRHIWDLQNGSQKIDDIEYGTQVISSDKISAIPLKLFARTISWSSTTADIAYCICKIYSCKIYEGTELVRDYVAASSNYFGAIGLLDKITNIFNTGSGTFTPGPVISGGD